MTSTPYTAMGEPVHLIGDDLFAVTYPVPISQEMAEHIKRRWHEMVGDKPRLVIFDGGATITRLSSALAAEPTPIFDALVAERQAL